MFTLLKNAMPEGVRDPGALEGLAPEVLGSREPWLGLLCLKGFPLRAREDRGSPYPTGGTGEGSAVVYLPRPTRPLLPDKFYEPLPGGFTHVLLINSHNLVTSQELVLRGASCRGEERGMRAWGPLLGKRRSGWESPVPEGAEAGTEACRKKRTLRGLVVGVLFVPLLPVPDRRRKTEE